MFLMRIGNIDLLITEGTTLSRCDREYESEFAIEQEAKNEFKKYNQILVLQSSTNMDRLIDMYKEKEQRNL